MFPSFGLIFNQTLFFFLSFWLKIRTNPKEAKEQSPKEESSLIIFLSFPFSGFFFGFMLMHFLSLSFCFFSYLHQHEFLLFLFLLSGGSKPNKSKKRIITARQEKEEEEERILSAAPGFGKGKICLVPQEFSQMKVSLSGAVTQRLISREEKKDSSGETIICYKSLLLRFKT